MDIGMHSGLIQEAKRFYCSNHHGNTQAKHPWKTCNWKTYLESSLESS